MISPEIKISIEKNLGKMTQIKKISGGANNLTFKIFVNNAPYFIKLFSPKIKDSYKKLNVEYNFTKFLHDNHVEQIAMPIFLDNDNLFSVFSFLSGEKTRLINDGQIRQAITFIETMNDCYTNRSLIVNAKDSAFSMSAFVLNVKKRFARFNDLKCEDTAAKQCLMFVKELTHEFEKNVSRSLINGSREFDKVIISPSDFGFHNILVNEGRLYFMDFEYAGFDSAFKLLADFLCQPQYPVDLKCINLFVKSHVFSAVKELKEMFIDYFYINCLKWCLIILNDFFYENQILRCHARRNINSLEQLKHEQLEKSIYYYNTIEHRVSLLKTIVDKW